MVYKVIDWQAGAWPRLLMVIVTPLTNQGMCWGYYGRSRERSVLFPNFSGKLVEEVLRTENSGKLVEENP
jgi:hypothetical protein